MKTGKIIAYNHNQGRGLLQCRMTNQTYHFIAQAVAFNESPLLAPGVQIFWQVDEGTKRVHFVEIMSTSFSRFKNKLLLERSIALD